METAENNQNLDTMKKSDLKNNHRKSIGCPETYHRFMKLSYQNASKCVDRKYLNKLKEYSQPC